jgi:F-type H+-transporting ATPase subunit b
MLIDWFTVGAQAVNFLVLVWLLKRFLYQPILDAIDERERRIAAELADADAKRAEAQQERETFKHKNDELDRQRAVLFTHAMDEAKAERQRLLEQARQAADALRTKRQDSVRQEADRLNQSLRLRTVQEVFAIARKTLIDLAGASLEERLVSVFIERLRAMDGEAHAVFALALKTATDPASVRSAFELPAAQRTAIQDVIDTAFAPAVPVRFETAPDLVSGIVLTANGQQIAWNIADYLRSLERGVGELLNEKGQPDAKVGPAPSGTDAPHP